MKVSSETRKQKLKNQSNAKKKRTREKTESKIIMQNLRKEARFPYAGTKNLLLFLWSTLVYLSMKYRVNGIEIPLDRKETAAAKRMVAKFMEEVEKNSKDTGNTSLYFTTLILMQVLSQEALDHIDSETLQKYMEACEKKRKESLPD